MDGDVQLGKPKGSPNLIKLDFLGMTVLLDYEERSVTRLSGPSHSMEEVMKYLVDEGFLVPVEEIESDHLGEDTAESYQKLYNIIEQLLEELDQLKVKVEQLGW